MKLENRGLRDPKALVARQPERRKLYVPGKGRRDENELKINNK